MVRLSSYAKKSKLPDKLFNFFLGTAHCADMYPSGNSDIDELKSARKKIQKILHLWLDAKKPQKNKYSVKIINKQDSASDGADSRNFYQV